MLIFANGEMTLSIGPFVEGNGLSYPTSISRYMGLSFTEDAGRQENYKGYKTVFNEEKITLGNIVLERINK